MPSLSREDYSAHNFLVAMNSSQISGFVATYFKDRGVDGVELADDVQLAQHMLSFDNFTAAIIDYDLELSRMASDDIQKENEKYDGGGLNLVRYIRRRLDGVAAEIPIIIVMGGPSKDRIYKARNAGCSEILGLPFSVQVLDQRFCYTVRNPKPFIRVETYTGPCRRVDRPTIWTGTERRVDVRDLPDEKPDAAREIDDHRTAFL